MFKFCKLDGIFIKEFYLPKKKKIMKKIVKLCLHFIYTVWNSFHFDAIIFFFNLKLQNKILPILIL